MKKDNRVKAVIDAAREAVKTIESDIDNCKHGPCRNCEVIQQCSAGILNRALRKYDKLARKEARRDG